MEYSTAALTDRYDIQLLTEDTYEQARRIAEKQEQAYAYAQNALFSCKEPDTIPLEQTIGGLKMFGADYTALNIASQDKTNAYRLWQIIAVLSSGTLAGCGLALAIQKKKRGTQE